MRRFGPLGATLAVAALLLLFVTGCARGVNWRFGRFEDAYNDAHQSGKLTFVYFRAWYLVECTAFEDNVLRDPDVLAETDRLVCVPLDFDWDKPLAQRWQVTAVPAFVLLAPSGELLARGQTPVTKAELLADLRASHRPPASGPHETTP
jgi:hypothetical protein